MGDVVARLARFAQVGQIRVVRFALVVVPATVVSLLLIPAIVLGWVSVAVASDEPIEVVVSSGSAQRLYLSATSDQRTSTLAVGSEKGAALLNAADGDLDDLCLLIPYEIPMLGHSTFLRLSTKDPVHVGAITLAMGGARIEQLDLPKTVVGAAAGAPDIWGAGMAPGGFSMQTVGGAASFTDLRSATFALVLEDGISLNALSLRAKGTSDPC